MSRWNETEAAILPYLGAYTRQTHERGGTALLTHDNWLDFARAHQHTSVSTKVHKLLKVMAEKTGIPGTRIRVNRRDDAALIDAASTTEMHFLIQHLKELDYIFEGDNGEFIVKIKGWQALEPRPGSGGVKGRCFVAMSFDPSMHDAYDSGIKPALTIDCELPEPIRVDREQFNEKIDDRILAEIRTCQFLVSDVTLHRPGVYFEAGFAMGLGRPVVWTCRRNDMQNAHFDTRQYNHIEWDSPGELREKLAQRVLATIQFS